MATSRSNPLYRYRLTRLGFHFLFVALFAIVGGSLRGFNLLLMLAGLLTSVVIVQWRQGRNAIRRTGVRRHEVTGTFAGSPTNIHYDLRNVGQWIPLWSMRIEDHVVAKVYPEALESGDQPPDRPVSIYGSVGMVPGGQTRRTSITCRFNHRGLYELGPVVASTTFPFCLMNCECLTRNSLDRIFVYPRLTTLRRGWTALLPPRRGGDGCHSTGGASHDGEFFGLRPWQSGDHVKHIHWRTTARIGQPAVRQFEQRNRHHVCVVVDGAQQGAQQTNAIEPTRGFEQVLQLAATLMVELATQTRSVTLLVADALASQEARYAEARHSVGKDLSEVLQRLAIAQPWRAGVGQSDPLDRVIIGTSDNLLRYDLVVVSCRPLETAVPRQQLSGGHLSGEGRRSRAIWRYFDQAGRLAWLDVNAAAVRHYLEFDSAEDDRPATQWMGRSADVGS